MIKKHYSIRKFNQKLDYKNQKYTVTEIVSSHAVCLNIEDIYSVFHIDWLHLTADDCLPSQPQFDDQPAPIHMKNEKKWYVNKIVAGELCCYDCDVMKWFQIKYMGYAVPKWNWVTNMEDTATLEQWMEHIREFQNAHGRLPDSFQHESRPGCAVEQGGIVTG